MSCYFIDREQPRMVRSRHDDHCPTRTWHPPLAWTDCAGCEECARPHCFVQWHGERGDCETHAESVCPTCLAKVREHLSEIVRLSGMPLLEQVLRTGDADTEAADLLGPSADPKQWRQRSDYGHIYEPDSRAGWHTHPLSVLGWFDMLVTAHLGHTRSTKITVTRAAGYLGRNLHFLAADVEFDFADMANALADCRGHLERVLHDGEQVETGAPCMTCRVPLRLVRGERDDRWQCPRCRQESNDDQYRFAIKADFIENATELNADDMAVRIGIASSTIRKWANVIRVQAKGEEAEELPAILKPSGRVGGRKVYRVEDVKSIIDGAGDTRRSEWATRTKRPA